MRTAEGDNKSHGAVVSDVKLSKENTTDKDADGVKRSHELTSAIPNKTRWSSGFTLRDNAKLNTFFELAKTGEQKIDDKTLIIPLKGGETTGFRVRDGRHGSDGIGGPHGEHSGHEGAGGVRFWVREAVEPLTGEAGLLGLTCGCEHCIVAQMLFRGEDVVAGWSGENNMAQGPRCCAPCAIVCLYLIGFRLPGRSGICCRDNDISCGSA